MSVLAEEGTREDPFECQPLGTSEVDEASIKEDDSTGEESLSVGLSSWGAATGFPFTPQASTGRTKVFRTWGVSLCHIRFAFRNTEAWQLYLIVIPAIVSWGLT